MRNAMLGIYGARYVLGEDERHVSAIPEFRDFLARHQMIDEPELWGWSRFRVSQRPVFDLAATAASATLERVGELRQEVDAVLFCATRFPVEVDDHADLTGRFLERLGLRHAVPYGVTLNRCATLMAGLELAEALVHSGRRRAVLLVAVDAVTSDSDRLRPFAVFSDGAASCVVAAGRAPDFALIGTATAVDATVMTPGGEISGALARLVNADLFKGAEVGVRDVRRVAHNNLLLPILILKEQQAGFRRDQLFLRNVARIGHVFACDPLINLVDMVEDGAVGPGDLVVLGSNVSGVRFGALTRKM